MKTVTTREFFRSPEIVKRPRRPRAELERQAREISTREKPKVNFTAALKELKGR